MRLARQIHYSLFGAVAIALVAFAILVLITSERLEHSLLDTMVISEADLLTSQLRHEPKHGPRPELPTSSGTAAWLSTPEGDGAPDALRELPLGISHDVRLSGHKYHVLRRAQPEGVLTVAVNIEALEERELALQIFVISGGLAIIVLLFVVARTVSRRVAGPLQQLADELDRLDPLSNDPSPLSGRYRGAEAHTIAEALDRYVKRLSELVERERSFSSSASHELRSPVSVMRNSLELIQMDPQLPEHLQKVAARAQRGADRLGEVLDGLMLLARDSVEEEVASIDAHATIVDVIAELPQDHPQIILDAATDALPLKANEAHLRILVSNLIRNAIDHAPGQPVTVRLNDQGLAVEDGGPGIALQILPFVFERSQRDHNSRGAGLGLYIAAEICRRHGWTIEASNLAPKGCRIYVAFNPNYRQ